MAFFRALRSNFRPQINAFAEVFLVFLGLQMSMFEKQKATLKMKEVNANDLIAGVVNTFTLKVEKYNGKITSAMLIPPWLHS